MNLIGPNWSLFKEERSYLHNFETVNVNKQ